MIHYEPCSTWIRNRARPWDWEHLYREYSRNSVTETPMSKVRRWSQSSRKPNFARDHSWLSSKQWRLQSYSKRSSRPPARSHLGNHHVLLTTLKSPAVSLRSKWADRECPQRNHSQELRIFSEDQWSPQASQPTSAYGSNKLSVRHDIQYCFSFSFIGSPNLFITLPVF